jgi:eukaryotic-like serine/threonine-protein kinase
LGHRNRIGVRLRLLLLRSWKPAGSGAPNRPLEITRLTTEGGLGIDPAISPDGKLLAYASDRSGEGNFDIWVRQIGGGDAIRLTRNPADDVEPNFSPDGTRIVFRSTRDGGGLYIIPALGGEERKIADGGRQPHFSPDGSRIAYWKGPADPNPLREGLAHAYILDLATSQTRRLRDDFPASIQPVWSPDGKHIVFLGLKDPKDIMNTYDWWITPLDGSPAVVCPVIGTYFTLYPFAWRGDRIYFTKDDKGRITIGEIRIDPKKWKPIGEPHALTTGTTDEYSPSVSKDGTLVFASIQANSDLYSLPLDANRGKVLGAPQRLTKEVGTDTARSISANGKKVAFTSDRSGVTQVWVKDLVIGQERALTTGGKAKTRPEISPDGQLVAWRENDFKDHRIFVTPFNGGMATQICADCGAPTDWSADGRYLVYRNRVSNRSYVGFLEIATGKKTDYLKRADQEFSDASLSRDGKWIVFAALRTSREFTIYVAPFSPNRTPPKSEWVKILQSPQVDPDANWSPDGDLLYFTSERDGFNCLWAQRLDHSTKQPRGELFAVQHFHTPSQVLVAPTSELPIALGPDKIVVSLNERSGGIWMLKLQN